MTYYSDDPATYATARRLRESQLTPRFVAHNEPKPGRVERLAHRFGEMPILMGCAIAGLLIFLACLWLDWPEAY